MERLWTRIVASDEGGRDFVVGDVHGCFRALEPATIRVSYCSPISPSCPPYWGGKPWGEWLCKFPLNLYITVSYKFTCGDDSSPHARGTPFITTICC